MARSKGVSRPCEGPCGSKVARRCKLTRVGTGAKYLCPECQADQAEIEAHAEVEVKEFIPEHEVMS